MYLNMDMECTALESDDDSDNMSGQEDGDFITSTPKEQRSRGRKRLKSQGRISTGTPSPDRSVGNESVVEDENMALGSSCITTGDDSTLDFDPCGNNSKKLKIDDQVLSQNVGGKGVSTDNQSVEASDMVARKGDDSSEFEDVSSGVTCDALLPGPSGEGDAGGL